MQALPPEYTQALGQAVTPWHDFYTVLGEASATLTGLLFVALSIASRTFSESGRGAQRIFLSSSILQFAGILTASLIVLVPLRRWEYLGAPIIIWGLVGLGFCAVAWRDVVRDGINAKIDLEDRTWYAVAPAVGYSCVLAAGILLLLQHPLGFDLLALGMGAMLVTAIHNAWDITMWSVTRGPGRRG